MNKKLEQTVRSLVESCDTDGVVSPEMKQTLADEQVAKIEGAIKKAKEDGRKEGRAEVEQEQRGVVKEAEENGFKRGVDAGVDQAKVEVDAQGEKCYTFLIELIRAIDTLQKLMVKIARAESYLEGYNKGKEDAGTVDGAMVGAGEPDAEKPEGDGNADGASDDIEPPAEGDGDVEAPEGTEDDKAMAKAESVLAQKFKAGSRLLIEATSKYLDKNIAKVLTESVVVDRGELEHLRMVVESIRNNVVLGDDRVTEYLTKIDRNRRQELMESRKENERLRKDNMILESTNKRLSAKNLLIEKTESLPSFERRQMRDAFRGVEDADLITESFDEKFREMKRNTVRETNARLVRRPVSAMVTESFDKSQAQPKAAERVVNESYDPTVASIVNVAASSIKQYSRKI